MPLPFDLLQQGAHVELDEVLSGVLRGDHSYGANGFSRPQQVDNRGLPATSPLRGRTAEPNVNAGARLDSAFGVFTSSPSPLPDTGDTSFSSPAPLEAQHSLTPDGRGGLTFNRPEESDDAVNFNGSSGGAVRLDQTADDISRFGLRVDDPFGTPDPGRAREVLRRLVGGS